MKFLNYLPFIALITCHAEALPDTNIQIQHYDGPVYLGTPSTNCCPFCNSILKQQSIDNAKEKPCSPELVYPTVYGNTCDNIPDTPPEITITVEPKEAKVTFDKSADCKNVKNERSCPGNEIAGNYGTILHTNTPKSVPMTCNLGSYGNTYTGTGIGYTRYPYGASLTGTECVYGNPLSNYLPINTASQSSCYQAPKLTGSNSDFMYSFILDGDVASNKSGCDSKFYYY